MIKCQFTKYVGIFEYFFGGGSCVLGCSGFEINNPHPKIKYTRSFQNESSPPTPNKETENKRKEIRKALNS